MTSNDRLIGFSRLLFFHLSNTIPAFEVGSTPWANYYDEQSGCEGFNMYFVLRLIVI